MKRRDQLFMDVAEACRRGDLQKVQESIDASLLSSRDYTGRSLLHLCTESEETAIASLLLSLLPDLLTLPDDDGYTVLHLSAISGNTRLLRFFLSEARRLLDPLQYEAFINGVDSERHTALHWAVVSDELDSLILLHSHGADTSLSDFHGARPIHYAAQSQLGLIGASFAVDNKNKTTQILKQLLAVAPQEIDARDKDDRTPLIWAASSGNLEALMTLITAKSDVSLQDKDGLTALHCAASRGFLECLEALITFGGAVVDAPDSNGCSPLFYAVTLGHADCVQFLLSNEAFVNQQDRRGRTAAHCGSTKGQLETIKILYNKGGNLWLRNVKGDFPLHEAVRSGRKDLVVWLLNHSPEGLLDFGNKGGKTPLHVASLENNVELAKVLIDYGLNVNSVMRLKGGLLVTPLDICLQKGFRSCAKFLLLHGALPSSKLDASRAGEGPSPTVYSRRFPDHQHHRQSDSDSGGAGYSSSIGFQSHYNGYHSSFHHNHTHTSESSNSLREVVLPITHHKQNPVVNGERGGRASRVSQRVKVFAEIPGTPSTVLSTATDSESTPHTMITNVYVSAYPAPRAMGSRKKLKKIRRRGGSKSRSPSVCRETQEPHSVDIWKAGDQEETNGSESEATRSSSLIDPLDLPEKIARDSIVEALQVIENGSSELTSTSEEVAQKDEKDRIRLEREIEPESEGHFLNVSTPEVEETISSLVLSKTPEAVDLEKNERLQTEADAEQNAGQEHKAEKQETAHANESFIAEKTDQNNNSDKTLKVTENKEVESFESQGDLVCDESPLQSPLLSFPDPLQDSSSFQSTQDIVGVKEEVPKEDSVKERAKRSVEHEEEKATSQGQQETSEQQENVQLGPIPPTLSSPLPVSDISITTSERDNLRTPSPLMLQPQMSILQTGDEEQGEIHLVVPNLTEEERSRSISPLDVNEYRESDLSSLPLIREVSEAEAVKIQQELIESQLKRESSEEKSQDANNNEKTKIPRPKKVVKKKTVIAEPMDPTKKLSLRPKGRGKWDKKVIGTPHDKVLPLTDKDRETAEDTLDEMTSIDTDDSNLKEMEEKKRQRRKQNQETRDEITEEVVFDLPSGQRIRATTTLELKTPVKKNDLFDDDENDEDRGDRKYATLPRISKGRKRDVEKRGMSSQCTHRLHRKQSLKPVPPIDLRNVKSKVDSKTPETFGLIRKSPSFHGKTTLSAAQPTDSRMDMNRFAHELSRSSKKYAIERKLFEELQDLKRCQIKANKSHETILVKKLADRFNADVYYPGLEFFSGSYDFESYEQFLYDQLQKLSLREASRAKASSEENINFLGIGESFLGQKSFSAEILMSKPKEHFHTRFVDLEDKDKSNKPGVSAPQRSPEDEEDDHAKSHRRITSDVVKTVEALDYGIITRAPAKTFQQSFLPSLMDPKTVQSKPSDVDRNVINVKTNVMSHHRPQDNKKMMSSNNDRTILNRTYVTTITSASSTQTYRTKSRQVCNRPEKRGSYSSPSRKRVPSRIPRKTPIIIDTEVISKRWEAIKEQERQRLEENRSRFQDSMVLLYEVSGSDARRRKSESHVDTGVQVSLRPLSRTMSDGDALPSTNNFCC